MQSTQTHVTCFKLEDEPELKFRKMIVFNGNNSLSRMAPLGGREVGDRRVFTSDYFLEPGFVDQFAHEVKPGPEHPDVNVTANGERTSTSTGSTSTCTDNWKAARDDAKKKSWGIFEETGIFACTCRHGIIQWIVDMIRSGELYVLPTSSLYEP